MVQKGDTKNNCHLNRHKYAPLQLGVPFQRNANAETNPHDSCFLVGGWAYPSEKYESVGMMTFPTEWKNNPNVPNHQPE